MGYYSYLQQFILLFFQIWLLADGRKYISTKQKTQMRAQIWPNKDKFIRVKQKIYHLRRLHRFIVINNSCL